MSTEIMQVTQQAGPYLSAALAAYGSAVLVRAESAVVDATADVGRRILHLVWCRRDAPGQTALEEAVREAASDVEDEDAAAALRQQIKRTLRDDAQLLREVAALLPAAGAVTITAEKGSIAAQHIGIAVTGNHNKVNQ
ncbi:hypothetical protein [Streptomyces avermitilis]|uniref:hypothetical protein n=1 Tax=Streptomyces avermitilis TaxID=33903 RepID=UPI0033B20ECC